MPKNALFQLLCAAALAAFSLAGGPLPIHAEEAAPPEVETLESGDRAVLSGDHVRVRSGPTLEHRIITKVGTGTEVTVVARGDSLQEIEGVKAYWYKVKFDSPEGRIEGWIFGRFLKRPKEAAAGGPEKLPEPSGAEPKKPLPQPAARQPLELEEAGSVDDSPLEVAAGDLDMNGRPELLFLAAEGGDKAGSKGRSYTISGYEDESRGFGRVYSVNMRNVKSEGVDVLATPSLEFPLLASKSLPYTYLYVYDSAKGVLNLQYKLATPLVALGTLDGESPFLVSLRKNKTAGSDGTVTYFIEAVRVEPGRGRILMKEKSEYAKPLPVKKLLVYDLDGDGRDEVVAEIGGGDSGGGIVALRLDNGSFTRALHTGIPTYDGSRFFSLWGAKVGGKPRLVVYSTDPASPNDAAASFGFIIASFVDGTLRIDEFIPVNKMLDETNNARKIVLLEGSGEGPVFLFVDPDQDTKRTTLKRTSL